MAKKFYKGKPTLLEREHLKRELDELNGTDKTPCITTIVTENDVEENQRIGSFLANTYTNHRAKIIYFSELNDNERERLGMDYNKDPIREAFEDYTKELIS